MKKQLTITELADKADAIRRKIVELKQNQAKASEEIRILGDKVKGIKPEELIGVIDGKSDMNENVLRLRTLQTTLSVIPGCLTALEEDLFAIDQEIELTIKPVIDEVKAIASAKAVKQKTELRSMIDAIAQPGISSPYATMLLGDFQLWAKASRWADSGTTRYGEETSSTYARRMIDLKSKVEAGSEF
jgi:hypothetical protein